MKNLSLLTLILVLIMAAASSCRQQEPQDIIPAITFSSGQTGSPEADTLAVKQEIFYGILTPVEICSIFRRTDARIAVDVLNPVDAAGDYLSASKAALNLGIYGVDMSYLKIFDMNNEMLEYMGAVKTLSDRLNIPSEYFTAPLRKIENNMADTDTVMSYLNEAYLNIEEHLGHNDRKSTAGLIVLGGWIEALYISTQQLLDINDPDPGVVQRIAAQKYTLNTLLSFLKNYYDDPVVVYYTKKLKFLKKYFDRFDIYFKEGDLEIDRKKQVLKASGSDMTISSETLRNIRDYAQKMREETISVGG